MRERTPPAFEGYCVRREDLRKALLTMREAQWAFDESTPVKLRTAAALLHQQLTGAARDSMKVAEYYAALTRAAAQLAQVVDIYRPQGRKLVRLTDAEIAAGEFRDGGNVFRTAAGGLYRGIVTQRAEVLGAIDMLVEARDVLRRMRGPA